MRPNLEDGNEELLELARATERVAEIVTDPAIVARLRAMADEVRAMARHSCDLPNDCYHSA